MGQGVVYTYIALTMDRLTPWIVRLCIFCSLLVLPAIATITVSMDSFKLCNENPYYSIDDGEEFIVLAKGNRTKTIVHEILEQLGSLEVSFCTIKVAPKRTASKQYMQAVVESLDITDCKVKVTIREATPSRNIVRDLSELSCKDKIPDTLYTTRDKNSINVVLNKDVDPSDGYNYRIKISLWEGPDKGGLSFAVKLVIGIACGVFVIIIVVLVIKTILYKRRVKKEEEDEEDIPESLPMRPSAPEPDAIHEKGMNTEQDRNSPSPNDFKPPPPPSYNELYDK